MSAFGRGIAGKMRGRAVADFAAAFPVCLCNLGSTGKIC